MSNKSENGKKSWLNTKVFYAVAMSLVIAIVGVASVIYNLSKIRNVTPDSGEKTGYYTAPNEAKSTAEHKANVTATGIPDDRDRTTSKTAEKSTANDLNRPYTGKFLLPLNSNVTKNYSDGNMVFSKTMGDWRVHDGIDIKGNVGDNALAVQDGNVDEVYNDPMWGDVIVIRHGNGLTVKYCGVKSELKKDAKVLQGQIIGTVVEIPTESKDGVHIHLETVVEDKNVDPLKALNLLTESTAAE